MSLTKPYNIEADHLAGTHKSYAIKSLKPYEVSSGKNYRQNKEGGRYPRPGYEDSQVDLSGYSFTDGRGIHSSRTPKKLWLAADTGAHVKICFVETTDADEDHYRILYDTGLTLQTGYYVQMIDWEGDIYYANGYNTVGRIVVGTVASGGVSAGSTTLNLKTGQGIRFPASGSGLITSTDGTMDSFSWTGKSTDQLTGVTGILAHVEGAVVVYTTTISPTYADKASVLAEWLASLNLGGDIDNSRVLEFSQFASAANLDDFYTFGSSPAGSEILGEGGEITGILATKNFLFTLKNTGAYASARSEINLTNGARIPQPIKKSDGLVNPRCMAEIEEDVAVYLTTDNRLSILRGRVEGGESTVALQQGFDDDIHKDLLACDTAGVKEWVHYEPGERLLKVCMLKDGVRYIYVGDFNVNESRVTWYDADQNKNYDVVTSHDGKTWAYDGGVNKLFIDEVGTYDDIIAIESEWLTGRMGLGEFSRGKAKSVKMHGYMTRNSQAFVEFYKDAEYQFTKTLSDLRVTSFNEGTPIGKGGIGSTSFASGGGGGDTAYPFRFPFGANRKGEDFQMRVRTNGDNGDFVQFDGFIMPVQPLRRSPYSRA